MDCLYWTRKYWYSVKPIVTGIYLDTYDQHLLVPYEHECNCFQHFVSEIDNLNTVIDSQENKNKLLQIIKI